MKNLFIILFICNNLIILNAQKVDNLKFNDSIYLKDIIESNDIKINYSTNGFIEDYFIRYTDTSWLSFHIVLPKKKYKDDNFYIKKKDFLKKEQAKIISLEDLYKIELSKLVYIFETKKIRIFIVDKNKFNKRKIYIKRAYMGNKVPIIM